MDLINGKTNNKILDLFLYTDHYDDSQISAEMKHTGDDPTFKALEFWNIFVSRLFSIAL